MALPGVETPARSGRVVSDISTLISSLTDTTNTGEVDEDDECMGSTVPIVHLSGRTKEMLLLLKTYLELRTTRTPQLVLLHGESGSGKTALVESLRMPVFDSKGYFVSGKYFQNSCARNPYSAIMTAFSDLCDLHLQDANFSESRRGAIQEALQLDGPILIRAISSLNSILHLPEDPDFPAYAIESSAKNDVVFALFKVACKKFLHVMASAQNPVVIFIDDIQWMDLGSQQLLQFLLQDEELENVMFILSYREESAGKVAGFVKVDTNNSRIHDIDLQNLDVDGVHQIVSAYMDSSSPKVRQLSELVYQRTMGNCYHIQQYLESIERDELLVQGANGRWIYDVDEIRCGTKVSTNLADILSRKIQLLSTDVQDTLKVASLLGYRFDDQVVVRVLLTAVSADCSTDLGLSTNDDTYATSVNASSVASTLSEALSSGFVEKITDCYQFSHDKVQTSFQSTMDDFEKANLHRLIAETYLSFSGGNELSNDYHAANHFHQAGEPSSDQDRVRLARLDLAAAKFSFEKSAFIDAAEQLRRGFALLDSTTRMWVDEYDLTFELTETLARMELILGNLIECKKLAALAIAHAKTIDMQINPILIDCEARMADSQVEEVITVCHSALRLLGVKLPSKVTAMHVLFKYLKIRRLIGKKTDEDVLSTPLLEDRRLATAIRLLFYSSTYHSLRESDHETVYFSLLGTELSLKRGLSAFSAPCLIIYALAETAVQNYERGDRFGKVALRLLDRVPSKEAAIPTILMAESVPLHGSKSIEATIDGMDRALRIGDDIGDTLFSIGALGDAFLARLMTGMGLASLEDFIRLQFQRLDGMSESGVVISTKPVAQFVLNMQTRGANFRQLVNLDGEMMNENHFKRVTSERDSKMMLWTMRFFKLQLATHFGFNDLAVDIVEEMEAKGQKLHFKFYTWYFNGCLANLEVFRSSKKRANLRRARHYYRGLLEKSDCPNARPFLVILAAEMLWLKSGGSRKNAVLAAYQNANATTNELGYCHMEALSNERAAVYLTSCGLKAEAKPYLDHAMSLYRSDWQASAKYEWLVQKHETTSDTADRSSIVGNVIALQ